MLIPQKTIEGKQYISTTPGSALAVLFPVVFAAGVLLAILAITGASDQPVGHHTVAMRGGGYADWRLWWGGIALAVLGFGMWMLAVTVIIKVTETFGVARRNVRLFSWVEVPGDSERSQPSDGSDAATPGEGRESK